MAPVRGQPVMRGGGEHPHGEGQGQQGRRRRATQDLTDQQGHHQQAPHPVVVPGDGRGHEPRHQDHRERRHLLPPRQVATRQDHGPHSQDRKSHGPQGRHRLPAGPSLQHAAQRLALPHHGVPGAGGLPHRPRGVHPGVVREGERPDGGRGERTARHEGGTTSVPTQQEPQEHDRRRHLEGCRDAARQAPPPWRHHEHVHEDEGQEDPVDLAVVHGAPHRLEPERPGRRPRCQAHCGAPSQTGTVRHRPAGHRHGQGGDQRHEHLCLRVGEEGQRAEQDRGERRVGEGQDAVAGIAPLVEVAGLGTGDRAAVDRGVEVEGPGDRLPTGHEVGVAHQGRQPQAHGDPGGRGERLHQPCGRPVPPGVLRAATGCRCLVHASPRSTSTTARARSRSPATSSPGRPVRLTCPSLRRGRTPLP